LFSSENKSHQVRPCLGLHLFGDLTLVPWLLQRVLVALNGSFIGFR